MRIIHQLKDEQTAARGQWVQQTEGNTGHPQIYWSPEGWKSGLQFTLSAFKSIHPVEFL